MYIITSVYLSSPACPSSVRESAVASHREDPPSLQRSFLRRRSGYGGQDGRTRPARNASHSDAGRWCSWLPSSPRLRRTSRRVPPRLRQPCFAGTFRPGERLRRGEQSLPELGQGLDPPVADCPVPTSSSRDHGLLHFFVKRLVKGE